MHTDRRAIAQARLSHTLAQQRAKATMPLSILREVFASIPSVGEAAPEAGDPIGAVELPRLEGLPFLGGAR